MPPLKTYELVPGIFLDARRTVWLEGERVLAIADPHLGYAWAQRERGLLLPLSVHDKTIPRLLQLQADYSPREIVVLGDVVHRAVPIPALKEELEKFVEQLGQRSRLIFLQGNHDKGFGKLFHPGLASLQLSSEYSVGPHLFLHGDGKDQLEARELLDSVSQQQGIIFIGHEHPAVSIGDGVTTALKCPCFLVSERLIVLPAFSQWAAGSTRGHYAFMSALCHEVQFTSAVAILGDKLLPKALN
jgi:uncharacterized protein